MTITFQKEAFFKLMPELPPLFYEHWKATELDPDIMQLDIDWIRYLKMEAAGVLHIMTARLDRDLVGYYFAIVVPRIHCKGALTAYSDMFWVTPLARKGWTGVKLFTYTEKMLRDLGVRKSYIVTKVHLPLTILLKRLKYKFEEKLHAKRL